MADPDVESVWLRFQNAARGYCRVIESVSRIPDSETFYEMIALPLAELYAAGRALPMVAVSDDDIEIPKLSTEEFHTLYLRINALTGSDDPYRTVFDPQEDTTPVPAALAVDLADIYRDVAPAVDWSDEHHLNDLLFELHVSFQGHWARHALEAMRVVHWRHPYW